MENLTVKKAVGGIAVVVSIVGGVFLVSDDMKKKEIEESKKEYIEKVERGGLTYSEYLELSEKYRLEVQKANEKGEMLDGNNSNIVDVLNDKILE